MAITVQSILDTYYDRQHADRCHMLMPWLKYHIIDFQGRLSIIWERFRKSSLWTESTWLKSKTTKTYTLKKDLISAGRFKLSTPSSNCSCHQIPACDSASCSRSTWSCPTVDPTTPLALVKTTERACCTPSSSPYNNKARVSNAAGEESGEDKRLIIWINREMLVAATLYCGESELGYLQIEMWSAWMPQEVSPGESKMALARGTITCKHQTAMSRISWIWRVSHTTSPMRELGYSS